MLQAHSKREAVRAASESKTAMISGLWSNPNYDDNKQTRRRAIDEIEENHREIISFIYGRIEHVSEEEIEQNPFFAAMELDEVPKDTPIPRPHDQEKLKLISELDQS